MIQKVRIIDRHGQWQKVWAATDGVFAVHKVYLGDGKCCGSLFDSWTITHVATGCTFASACDIRRDAVAPLLKWLRSLKWQGIKFLENIPVCELLNNSVAIQADLASCIEPGEWEENLPIIKRAHLC